MAGPSRPSLRLSTRFVASLSKKNSAAKRRKLHGAGDTEKSALELLDEYFRLIDKPERPEYGLRVREIMAELRKKVAQG